jgi:DNA topoisomerase IB
VRPKDDDSSTEVNNYLRDASGVELTAKDFRTWHGSVFALSLMRRDPATTPLEVPAQARCAQPRASCACRPRCVNSLLHALTEFSDPQGADSGG